MRLREWKIRVESSVSDPPPRPSWHDGVPFCSEQCVHFDGKRCAALGLRAPNVCEPVVSAMSAALNASLDQHPVGRDAAPPRSRQLNEFEMSAIEAAMAAVHQ